jgi:hypothetical protein
MKPTIHAIKILGSDGSLVDAELIEDIRESELDSYEQKWKPILAMASAKTTLADRPQDTHWDWSNKVSQTRGESLRYLHFSIRAKNELQGMMQLEISQHRSRMVPQAHIAYVDYLATAPWNRLGVRNLVDLKSYPMFRGIGSVLLKAAIETSKENEFGGRISLHSLKHSAGFYQKLGMVSYGLDVDYLNLEYFEFDAQKALQFIADTGGGK